MIQKRHQNGNLQVQRVISLVERAGEHRTGKAGKFATGLGSFLAMCGVLSAIVALYSLGLAIFSGIMAPFVSPDVTDWECGQLIYGFESIIATVATSICFLVATLLLKKRWWRERFWLWTFFVCFSLLLSLFAVTIKFEILAGQKTDQTPMVEVDASTATQQDIASIKAKEWRAREFPSKN